MTLQASGAISLSQIRAEFGGSAPDSLSEYYRGGAHVPNTPGNAAIPTSGAIAMSNFYGTAAVSYTLTDSGAMDVQTASGAGTAFAGYNIFHGGTWSASTVDGTVDSGDWIAPTSAAPGSYTIRAHLVSGNTPSGTLDTDLAFSIGDYGWALSTSTPGAHLVCTLTLTLKLSGVTVDTCTVGLDAELLPF